MRDDQLIFEILKMRPRARWPCINDVVLVENDIQVNGSWPIFERWDPPNVGLDPLEYLEECNRWQVRLDLKQKRGKWPSLTTERMEARTKQAPLTKLGWSVTYMGEVSYKKLVSIITISASF